MSAEKFLKSQNIDFIQFPAINFSFESKLDDEIRKRKN